ncbi:MAG: XdhC/CoxI family protein [Armatimonadetes bacterium]|nr:XdhC/CoxI family protein [Armatimonadota bacterium]
MPSFYEQLLESLEAGERFALGTVVHTHGSTPQKKGARALFYPDGRIVGTLGGGCLEAEARRRALLALRRGDPFHFTVQLDNDFGWDDGLICGGTATVLIEPDVRHHLSALRGLVGAVQDGERVVLATVVEAEEAQPGDTLLFRPDAPPVGDDLPSSLHSAMEEKAGAFLQAPWQEPQQVELPGHRGRAYLEPHYPLPSLLIIGGGHIGAALAHYAARLDFAVSVLDDRPSLVTPDRFPEAKGLIVDEITEGIRKHPIRPDSYVVIVTRGHQHDAEALREAVATPAAYIGMIGSRRKVHVIFQGLLEEGLATPEQLRRVRAPIGLDIDARSVEEIALSIAAELVAVRAKVRVGADPFTLFPEGETYVPLSARRSPKSIDFGF